MLTAGDEFGRSQRGNNNAYAQDNEIAWIDWDRRDCDIEDHAATLAALRARVPMLRDTALLSADDAAWLDESGEPMRVDQWEDAGRRRVTLFLPDAGLAIAVNGADAPCDFVTPLGVISLAERCVGIHARHPREGGDPSPDRGTWR
jgi:glycogen operon protein